MFKKKIEIDPVAQNLVNRIAPGTVVTGTFSSEGGLLVQGEVHCARMEVRNGPLIVQAEGKLKGNIVVTGDVWIFGQAGEANAQEGALYLEVHGAVHVAAGARTYGTIACQTLATYSGCQLNSTVKTIPVAMAPKAGEPATA